MAFRSLALVIADPYAVVLLSASFMAALGLMAYIVRTLLTVAETVKGHDKTLGHHDDRLERLEDLWLQGRGGGSRGR